MVEDSTCNADVVGSNPASGFVVRRWISRVEHMATVILENTIWFAGSRAYIADKLAYGVLCWAERNLLTNNPCEKSAVMSLRHIPLGEIKGDAPIYGKFAIVYHQCLNQVSGLTWWANTRHWLTLHSPCGQKMGIFYLGGLRTVANVGWEMLKHDGSGTGSTPSKINLIILGATCWSRRMWRTRAIWAKVKTILPRNADNQIESHTALAYIKWAVAL